MGFLNAFDKFGKGLKKGFTDFGVKAEKGLATAGKFIEKKALPVLQKVASGVAAGAKYLAPALAFTPLAEFAPIVAGIGVGAGIAAKAIGGTRKVIQVAGQAVEAAKKPSIEKAVGLVQSVGQVRGAFGT
jgi:hypothetical protein